MTAAEKERLAARALTGVRLSCQILCDHDMTVRAISRLEGSGRPDPDRRRRMKLHPRLSGRKSAELCLRGAIIAPAASTAHVPCSTPSERSFRLCRPRQNIISVHIQLCVRARCSSRAFVVHRATALAPPSN